MGQCNRADTIGAAEVVSSALLIPADDAKPIELRQLVGSATLSELLGDLVEVVRARGLHELAPEF